MCVTVRSFPSACFLHYVRASVGAAEQVDKSLHPHVLQCVGLLRRVRQGKTDYLSSLCLLY